MRTFDDVAHQLHVAPDELEEVVQQVVQSLRQSVYYHYVSQRSKAQQPGVAHAQRSRSVMLFRAPDEALTFAQRVGFRELPKVRSIKRELAVLHMLAEPSIEQLIFLDQDLETLPRQLWRTMLADLPGAVAFARADLVQALYV